MRFNSRNFRRHFGTLWTKRHALYGAEREITRTGKDPRLLDLRVNTHFSNYSTKVGHDNIVRSPYADIDIPEMNLCHYLISNFAKYSHKTALVSVLVQVISLRAVDALEYVGSVA